MAIPVYERQLDINLLPGVRAADVVRPLGVPADIGADMAGAASEPRKAAMLRIEEYEDVSTLEAFNNFQREVSDYHRHPEKGIYRAKLGKGALGAADAADEWIGGKADEYAGKLPRRAAENFARMAAEARNKYYADNQDWEARQFEAYRDAEADGVMEIETDGISAEWGDDEAVRERLGRIMQALELKTRGLGEKAQAAAVSEITDRIALTRTAMAAEHMPAGDASAWLESHRDDFSAAAYEKARLFIEEKGKNQRVSALAETYYGKYGTDERAAKKAIYSDPSIAADDVDSVWAKYESRAVDERRFRKEAEEALLSDWWDRIEDAGDYTNAVDRINDASLDAKTKKKLLGFARQVWAQSGQEDDPALWFTLSEDIDDDKIARPEEILQYADRLSKSSVKELMNKIKNRDGGDDPTKLDSFVKSMVGPVLRDSVGNADFHEQAKFARTYARAAREARNEKGAPLDARDKSVIVSRLLADVIVADIPSIRPWPVKYKMPLYEHELALEEGFVWNDAAGDFIRTDEDGNLVTTWKQWEKALREGNVTLNFSDGGEDSGADVTPPGDAVISMFLPNGGVVTSLYGQREKFRAGPHTGVDMAGRLGDPISAPPGEWRVVSAVTGKSRSADTNDAGNRVILAPAEGGSDRIYLNHLDSVSVAAGDIVSGGDLVGGMGNSGYTVGKTGVHLDLKVKSDGRWVDPFVYFGEM
jgi:murein DD-endopeptidase MepM/ murein hydrolase activator NlpD